jgi:hypothetical protein
VTAAENETARCEWCGDIAQGPFVYAWPQCRDNDMPDKSAAGLVFVIDDALLHNVPVEPTRRRT